MAMKWEYKEIRIDHQESGAITRDSLISIQEAGEMGWELVSIQGQSAIFKRRKQTTQ